MGKFQPFRFVNGQYGYGIDAVGNRDGETFAVLLPPIQKAGKF